MIQVTKHGGAQQGYAFRYSRQRGDLRPVRASLYAKGIFFGVPGEASGHDAGERPFPRPETQGRDARSRSLRDAFKQKFRQSLETRLGRPIDQLDFYPIPILVRYQPGYRIGIHADVPAKAITVQFYLPSDNSQRHLGTMFHHGRAARTRSARWPWISCRPAAMRLPSSRRRAGTACGRQPTMTASVCP